MDKLAASLGVVGLSKSQGSAMAEELHETVHSFRSRPHILIAKGRYILIFSDRHVT